MSDLVIRGLPKSLAHDGWWLEDSVDRLVEPSPQSYKSALEKTNLPWIMTLGILVVLADFLFWEYSVGISLIVFSAALSSAALVSLRPVLSRTEWSTLAAAWCALALPIVEFYQALSILFLVVGHTGLLIWCAKRSNSTSTLRMVLRFPFAMTAFVVVACIKLLNQLLNKPATVGPSNVLSWVMPLGFGTIFFLLFLGANPVFERMINGLNDVRIDQDTSRRVAFWIVMSAIILPFVMFKTFQARLKPLFSFKTPSFDGAIVNAKSVTNSLMLFNAMFFLQNLSDIAILWGGAELPEGMTYATYAHRGAYPLMWTSVLAGIFALLSRPFTDGSTYLKGLLLIWVVQNVVLLGSALMRLDLYIDVYGLTYLRVRVAIGMLLVMVGMVLMVWQLWRAKSSLWLTQVFGCFAVGVFYICCFVNFGFFIASTNLENAQTRLDTYYLCNHTPSGVKALYHHVEMTGDKPCNWSPAAWSFDNETWRDWSIRGERLEHYRGLYLQSGAVFAPNSRDTLRGNP